MSAVNNSKDELFNLTWFEILYDGGIATWVPRSSFRWLTISVCLIGVLGNILAINTLLHRRMRTLSTYTYLTALCISNTVTLLSVIIFEVDVLVEPNEVNCLIVSTAKGVASSSYALSTWITVGFTLDRYVMICFPFVGKDKCTRRNALVVIFMCLVSSITYLIPQLFAQSCHAIVQYPYNSTHTDPNELALPTYWVSGLSEMGKSSVYRLTITLFFNCFLTRIIPFVIIFFANYRLIQALSRTKRRHRRLNPYQEKHNDITHMLVIVLSIYLVTIIPSILFAAFFAYDPHQYVTISFHHRSFQYVDELAKFLLIFNSALQCYLYIFFGKRFRRELSRFLCSLGVKYCHMPIPQAYTNIDREHYSPDVWNPDDAFELILQGQWSFDQRQDSITALEFNFHYSKRRLSRFASSSFGSSSIDSRHVGNQINLNLFKRLKTLFESFFSRSK